MNMDFKKSNIAYCIIAIVIGLLLIIIPRQCIKIIVILLGLFSIANGIYNLVKIKNLISDPDFKILITVRGLFSIVVGILAVLLPLIFAGVLWTVMVYTLAVFLILTAGMELYATVKMKNAGIETKPYITEIVFSILLGILLFFIPPKTFGEIIVRIIGAIIVLISVAFLIVEFKNRPLIVYAEEVPNDPNDTTTKK
ncbi:MAG: DUF308 domain-containing protein [Treponemataceae bacterium]|nr:DUF308 domain-containing protein [Treponemataceae bacterium]